MSKGKQAISVTLDADNLTWLKARTGAGDGRSVSALLDQLVTAARRSGRVGVAESVVGTIDIDPGDAMLDHADEAMRQLFAGSLGRSLLVKESRQGSRAHPPKTRRG